jgi:hypothetical protein
MHELSLYSQEGQTKIHIRHLPHSIGTESAHVTGLGDAQLFDVVCFVGSSTEEIDTASTAEAIRKLKARVDVLVDDVDSINDISQTMMTYSRSIAGDSSVPPRQAERFFENLLSRSRAMTSTRADLEEEILQLTRQIDALSSTEKKRKEKMDGEVSVVVMTKQATDIQLRLTYRKSSSILNVHFFLLDYSALFQLFEVRYGLRHMSYTPPRKQAYLHHRYLCITVPASHKAPVKIGQTSSSR